MSPIQFARAISEGEPLKLFNYGEHQRDFTYVDDIVESIARLIEQPPQVNPQWDREQPDPASSMAPWRLFNIGGQHPVELKTYLALMEKHLGQKALVELLPLQPGDVLNTCADASDLAQATGFQPRIELDEGLGRFIAWFRDYYPTAYRPRAARG
jgi:UDP-glucuronate 4-epimerase